MDTIVALASAPGRAGVAVVRISGTRAWDVCQALAGAVPVVRQARLMRLKDASGELIDEGLVLVFEAGHSFTGERVCEFQVHGSVAAISALLRACVAIEGVRFAEAGEFTKRAFLAGRLDLTEVEALADLIDAETELQRKQAQAVLDGSAGRIIETWREDLLQALAMIEATLDFSEEDIPQDISRFVKDPLQRVLAGLASQQRGRRAAEAVRDGFEVAIVGRVNAGKSTLLNALAGRDAAITSAREGTTRDVIEVRMDIGGLAVTLMDTAGLRETDDEIERLGIERGLARARKADLRVVLLSAPEEKLDVAQPGDIVILAKSDLWGLPGVSVKTGEGVDALIARVEKTLVDRVSGSSVFNRERHFGKLQQAERNIENAISGLEDGVYLDIVGEEVRLAIRSLDGIVGRVDVEDVLGRIFSSFCIGK